MPAALQAEQEAEQQVEPVGRMVRALREKANDVEHIREQVVKLKGGHKGVSHLLQAASMDPQALRDYADRLEAGTLTIELPGTEVTVSYWTRLVEGETVVACVSGELNLEGTHLEGLLDAEGGLDDLRDPVDDGEPEDGCWPCDGSLPFDRIDHAGTPRWIDAR
jgi:hypothetical protein